MQIYCLCGHENQTLMPFDDPTKVKVACTNACKTARQLKADLAPRPLSEKLSDAFRFERLDLPKIGMLGH